MGTDQFASGMSTSPLFPKMSERIAERVTSEPARICVLSIPMLSPVAWAGSTLMVPLPFAPDALSTLMFQTPGELAKKSPVEDIVPFSTSHERVPALDNPTLLPWESFAIGIMCWVVPLWTVNPYGISNTEGLPGPILNVTWSSSS